MSEKSSNLPAGPGPDFFTCPKIGVPPRMEPSPIMTREMLLGLKLLHEQDYSKPFVVSPSSIAQVRALYELARGNGVQENQLKKEKPLINANLILQAAHIFCKDDSQNAQPNIFSVVDFHNNPHVTINETISSKTKFAIQKLLNQDELKDDTDILLASALFFKAAFRGKREFPTSSRKVFYKKAGQKRQQKYWTISNFAGTNQDPDFEVYTSNSILGRTFKFSIICPKKDFNLPKIAKKLDADRLKYLLDTTEEMMMTLHIPMIQLESKSGVREASQFLGDGVGDGKKVRIAHAAAVKFDKLVMPTRKTTKARASKSLYSGEDETVHVYPEFTANQPFIWTISKGDHLILMGYYC
ncbi:hypothetical protein CAEBREN_03007 [Caenorhabditis brenneri]|uniref:Serpin domain-containing protein n=1 Tax=Caenorhabditis brenneri TaxID=135651 RepID=G0MA03_CAEBE|nr:hypothetical protein CAEBREN_03007 [Caenorhabditis brenneri]